MTSSKRHARLQELFFQVVELPRLERSSYLEHACGDDEAIQSEVEALLAADESANQGRQPFLDEGSFDLAERLSPLIRGEQQSTESTVTKESAELTDTVMSAQGDSRHVASSGKATSGDPALAIQDVEQVLSTLGIVSEKVIQSARARLSAESSSDSLLKSLIEDGHLTEYQVSEVVAGRAHRLVLGNYVIRGRIGAGGMGLLGLAALVVLWAAGVIFKVKTKDGTLVLKVTGDNFATWVQGKKVTVKNTATDEEVTIDLNAPEETKPLKPGPYQFMLTTSLGLTTKTDRFTIRSGKNETVEVWWEPKQVVAKSQPHDTLSRQDPDRRAVEWVLSIGGTVTIGIYTPAFPKTLEIEDPSQLPDGPFVDMSVNIAGNPRVTGEGLTNLRGSQLSDLGAWDTSITDQGLANLTEGERQPLKNLGNIHIARTAITDTGLRYLTGSANLNRLHISSTQVSDGTLLREFPQLDVLEIDGTKISAEDLSVLKELPLLRLLSVDGSQLEGVGSRYVSSLHALTSFAVVDPGPGFDSAVLKDLQELKRLALLWGLSEDQLDDGFWSTLAGLPNLGNLGLGTGVTDALIGRMPILAKLRVLNLHHEYGKLSGETIAAAVDRLPRLEELGVQYLALSDADGKHLESLTQLKRLTIAGNPDLTADAVAALHKALPNCRIESDHGTFEPPVAADSPE